MQKRQELSKIYQQTSAVWYNFAFTSILPELTNTMSDYDTLFDYLCGLKDNVQQAVIVQNSQDFNTTMSCADNTDNAIWFSEVKGGHRGGRPRRQLP